MSTNKSYKKWLLRVLDTDSPWTENDIIYFRKYIRENGKKYPELRRIFDEIATNDGYRITQEQDQRGRQYLLDNSLRRNGYPRKHNKLGISEVQVLTDRFSHHLLVGLYDSFNPYSGLSSYTLPIYRAVNALGESFEYTGTTYKRMEVVA